jgi:peptidoglycan/LPS O-acetylase OafA/YrhL
VVGFALAGEPALREAIDRHWRTALAIAIAASAALAAWAWPGHVLTRLPAPRSPAGALLWGGYAITAWCWLVALRGGARHHLAGARTPALVRASTLAYPFYVLHHPVIVAAAVAVVVRRPRLPAAFAEVWGSSLAVTIALCAAVGASGPLRVLFGLRRRARPPPGSPLRG